MIGMTGRKKDICIYNTYERWKSEKRKVEAKRYRDEEIKQKNKYK